jgi:phage/plasmid-associated DNA primase
MQEPGDNEKINIGLMKELSGGDPIFARGLYKEGGEFKPQFKMIMACNDLPNVPSNDGGTWRRIRVVPFDSKFTDNPDKNNKKEFNIDADIMDKIERWTETFISMLIHIHKTTDLKVIKEPSDINIATQKYKENNDIIGQYLAEKIVVDTKCKKKMLLNTLSSDFKTWAFNQLKGSNKITPDRLQVKAYVENIYGPYNGGWYGFKFKSDIDTEDSDVE